MRTFLTLFLMLNALTIHAFADDQLAESSTEKKVRILSLLPEELLVPLAVEPAIPENFVAMSPSGRLNAYEWTYWGPKDVLEAFFKDGKSLSQSIIRVRLGIVKQADIENPDKPRWAKELKAGGFETYSDMSFKWGEYPVYVIRAESPTQTLLTAWAGLNDPQDGWTMQFQLLYPLSHEKGNDEDIQLWKNFLANTDQLPEHLFFIAHGQDLQEGYTLVNIGGAKLKVVAERREHDNKLQVVVMPLAVNVSFDFKKADEGLMAAQWHHKEPLAKVYGLIKKKDENCDLITGECLSVLIKNVQEFSLNGEALKLNPRVTVYQK